MLLGSSQPLEINKKVTHKGPKAKHNLTHHFMLMQSQKHRKEPIKHASTRTWKFYDFIEKALVFQKGKGKRRKMAADGRPEIRNLPNFYGDPIEDIEDD